MLDRSRIPKEDNFKVGLWRMLESMGDVESFINDLNQMTIQHFHLVDQYFNLLLSLKPYNHRQCLPG